MWRPNRSDEHLLPEEETREYFEEKLPKRHPKPQRSDCPGDHNVDASIVDTSDQESSTSIPELDKLRRLEADPEKLVYDHHGSSVHRWTITKVLQRSQLHRQATPHVQVQAGTGFIKVEMEKKDTGLINLLGLPAPPNPSSRNASSLSSCRGNPATNEWIPSADDDCDDDAEIPTIPEPKPNRTIGVNLMDDMPKY